MRICSQYHDYYDGAQAYGSDQSRVFLRETSVREVKLGDARLAAWAHLGSVGAINGVHEGENGSQLVLRGAAIGFCGKAFKALRVRLLPAGVGRGASTDCQASGYGQFDERTFYDAHAATDYLESTLGKARLEKKKSTWHDLGNPVANGTLRDRVESLFAAQGRDTLMDWCLDEKVAIAMMQARKSGDGAPPLVINPPLAPVQFYKVLGPADAYQELDMFWGGVLAPEAGAMAVIEDRYRIAQRGFDKHSFRKAPTRKR